jgi:hypothetical protein
LGSSTKQNFTYVKIPYSTIKHLTHDLLISCGSTTGDKEAMVVDAPNPDTIDSDITNDNAVKDTIDTENATYFVVVVDTGIDYPTLNRKMYEISKKYSLPIDTMGRSYNKVKNLIALPDDSEDEIYAGDYIPRRFPSEDLSLEYLDFYQSPAGENTIALVSGIFETEQSAEDALRLLQRTEKKSFKIKADIFVGCMH